MGRGRSRLVGTSSSRTGSSSLGLVESLAQRGGCGGVQRHHELRGETDQVMETN